MLNTIDLRARRRRSQALRFLKALRSLEAICVSKDFQDLVSCESSELPSGNVINMADRKVVPTRVYADKLKPISLAA